METAEELNFLSALLPLAGILFVVAMGVILLNQHFHKNLYRQKLEQEELKAAHQQELLKSSIQVQEEERKRIAQDLHDELGAALSIARMHLVQLEQLHGGKAEDLRAAIKNVRNLTETSLAATRRISHELMPPQLESFGLVKTWQALADQLASANGFNVEIDAPENLPSLPWSINLGLYRISMELIHNTMKHAHASKAWLELRWDGSAVTLRYSDDGKGLPKEIINPGLGLKSIEARVNSLKGTIEWGVGETKGFNALFKIPLDKSK
jgi:signal transduction histidine kinase